MLAQRIYYTHLGAEEDGRPLGEIVRDKHIKTQWQGNSFSVTPASRPPVTGCILTLLREKLTALVEEGQKGARQQCDSQSCYTIPIANIVYF